MPEECSVTTRYSSIKKEPRTGSFFIMKKTFIFVHVGEILESLYVLMQHLPSHRL